MCTELVCFIPFLKNGKNPRLQEIFTSMYSREKKKNYSKEYL